MPIAWTHGHFTALRDAIDAKGITLEQAIDAINKVGVFEKPCYTCKFNRIYWSQKKCPTCDVFSNYELRND